MKSSDGLSNALLCVQEVATFAFSVVELLFTRILPLTGYLLFHLCRILASFLLTNLNTSTAGRRRWRPGSVSTRHPPAADQISESASADHASYWSADQQEDDVVAEYLSNQLQWPDAAAAGTYKSAVGYWTSSPTAPPSESYLNEVHHHICDTVVEEEEIVKDTEQDNTTDIQSTNLPDNFTGDGEGNTCEATITSAPRQPIDTSICSERQDQVQRLQQAMAGQGQSNSKADLESIVAESLMSTATTIISPASIHSTTASNDLQSSTASVNTLLSRPPRLPLRVLPPSMSQIKRSLMRRSRRSSPAAPGAAAAKQPGDGSPISPTMASVKEAAASSYNPAKMRSSRSRVMKSSSSYENFMSKFKKHFLVDSPKSRPQTQEGAHP